MSVWRSEDDSHWTVQIDTTDRTGPVAVDLNDGRVFLGDPEVFDAVNAARTVLRGVGAESSITPGTLQLIVDAVRGEG